MVRFSFLHAADLHLDTPFAGLSRTSPEMAAALRDASLEAFDLLVQCALERRVDAVFLAGDIYDGPERGLRAQIRFLRGLENLTQAGIRVFIVHGNHDPLEGWSAVQQWPEGVRVFGCEEAPEVDEILVNGRRAATVQGISFRTRHELENLARRFHRPADSPFAIGLLHCHLGVSPEHQPYAPAELDDLINSGLDYWALGHIHRHAVVRRAAPCIVYPGNLQGRSTKPSEAGIKGAVYVEVNDRSIQTLELIPLDRVRFRTITVDVSNSDFLSLPRRVSDQLLDQSRRDAGRSLVITLVLSGVTLIHSELRRAGALDELLRQVRDDTAGIRPVVWVDAIELETTRRWSMEDVLRRDDIIGEAARRGTASTESAVSERENSDLAELFRYDVVRDVMAEYPLNESLLQDEAVRLAVDLLLEDPSQ